MRLALYQPDIPQNTGTILRMAACLGVPVDIIEPCGFVLDDARFRRALMDYAALLHYERHKDYHSFAAKRGSSRIILLTTKDHKKYMDFDFHSSDTLLLGSESAGVPDAVHASVDARLTIPMQHGARSLNVAVSAAMVLGEALRQTQWNTA